MYNCDSAIPMSLQCNFYEVTMSPTHGSLEGRLVTVTLGEYIFAQGYLVRMIDDCRAEVVIDRKVVVGRLIRS